MRIGLVGAHRTGKTTLARELASRLNLEMVPSQVSAIAKQHSFDMDKDRRDNPQFFRMQQLILASLDVSGRDSFISDRTPLDAAAYLIADFQADTGSAVMQDEVLQYVDSAVRMTDAMYDAVILVPPGIDFDAQDGKPGANLAYQEHHHLLCAGICAELSITNGTLERDNLDLTDRADAVEAFLAAHGVAFAAERRRVADKPIADRLAQKRKELRSQKRSNREEYDTVFG